MNQRKKCVHIYNSVINFNNPLLFNIKSHALGKILSSYEQSIFQHKLCTCLFLNNSPFVFARMSSGSIFFIVRSFIIIVHYLFFETSSTSRPRIHFWRERVRAQNYCGEYLSVCLIVNFTIYLFYTNQRSQVTRKGRLNLS